MQKCEDFTLHWKEWESKIEKCKDCETEYSDVLLADIPDDKLVEQRKRYKEANERDMLSHLYTNPLEWIFSDPGSNVKIIEAPAGQDIIDQVERQKQNEEYNKRRIKREEERKEVLKYKNLRRNDICICGKLNDNGKPLKYKKCCLDRINNYKL